MAAIARYPLDSRARELRRARAAVMVDLVERYRAEHAVGANETPPDLPRSLLDQGYQRINARRLAEQERGGGAYRQGS